MLGRPSRRKPLSDELLAEERLFAEAFRETMDSVRLAQSRIADRAGVGQATISCYLHGVRIPQPGKLKGIYSVLEEAARQADTKLPYSLSKLLCMRSDALWARNERSGIANDAPTTHTDPHPAVPEMPAPRLSRAARRIRRRRRIAPTRGQVSALPTRIEVPVPPEEGDRHLNQDADVSRAAEVDAYRGHQTAGRTRDAYMVLWGVAKTLPVREFPAVVTSYRAAGLGEAADTLLRTAALRDVQAAVNIAAALHDNDQYEDASVILNAARTDS
ncbi:hypothetical protein ACIQVC_36465 [Streptomyces sp. NPDC101112]|uniref:hypothetical protein n=1 Tax=Streptomyces sp. NPDC101112 TaxID=3366105 RepID=UPI00382DA617